MSTQAAMPMPAQARILSAPPPGSAGSVGGNGSSLRVSLWTPPEDVSTFAPTMASASPSDSRVEDAASLALLRGSPTLSQPLLYPDSSRPPTPPNVPRMELCFASMSTASVADENPDEVRAAEANCRRIKKEFQTDAPIREVLDNKVSKLFSWIWKKFGGAGPASFIGGVIATLVLSWLILLDAVFYTRKSNITHILEDMGEHLDAISCDLVGIDSEHNIAQAIMELLDDTAATIVKNCMPSDLDPTSRAHYFKVAKTYISQIAITPAWQEYLVDRLGAHLDLPVPELLL